MCHQGAPRTGSGLVLRLDRHTGKGTVPERHLRIVGARDDSARGILARIRAGLPGGGEDRPGQATMAALVETTITKGGTLVVQAGTGQGKSFAGASGAAAARQKVVYVTSTLSLQNQIARKDLPLVASQLAGSGFSFAVLKGRSNYLCLESLACATKDRGGGNQGRLVDVEELDDDVDVDQIASILAWSEATETGDKVDLSLKADGPTWDAVSRGPATCLGKDECKFGDACFAERARTRSAQVDVLVVNTHLYALNVATSGAILPPHPAVIFDEAHSVETTFTAALGTELGAGPVRFLAKSAKRVLRDERTIAAAMSAAENLDQVLTDVSHSDGRYGPTKDVTLGGGARSIEEIGEALDQVANAVGLVQLGLAKVPDVPEKVLSRKKIAEKLAAGLLVRIDAVSYPDKGAVVWIEGGKSIKTAPVDVGAILDRWFWTGIGEGTPPARTSDGCGDECDRDDDYCDIGSDEEKKTPLPPRSVIFTSATIPSTLVSRLRVPCPVVADVGSPFDFAKNGILYMPRIIDPRCHPEEWRSAVQREIADLIMAAEGRTLALFTSYAAMREAAKVVGRAIPYRVLVQGDTLSNRQLVEEFAEDEGACLFATQGFFHGIDVPGATLSLVTVDRIPFPPPDAPLIKAWADAAGGGFNGYISVAVPLAGTALAQAAGRLIRRASDRGVVAVLDSRLATAGYREQILKALPPMRRVQSKAVTLKFLASIAEEQIKDQRSGEQTTGPVAAASAQYLLGTGSGDVTKSGDAPAQRPWAW
ncbi:MAG: ATP-dependent DNA helicase [Acidimicrobiales bacterium]